VPQVLINYSYLSELSSKKKRRRQLWNRLRVQATHFTPLKLHAWLGILKTLIFFITPMKVTTKLKKILMKVDNKNGV